MLSIMTFLRALLEALGILKSDKAEKAKKIKDVTAKIESYEKKLSIQQRKLEDIKSDYATIQERILLKEKERNTQTGEIRKITESEIVSLFKAFESKAGERDLIVRNVRALDKVIAKFKELRTALDSDLDTEELDTLILDLQDLLGDLKEQDRQLEDLGRIGYKSKETQSDADLEAQLASLHKETAAAAEMASAAAKTSGPRYDMPEKKTDLPRFDMPEKTAEPTQNDIDALLKSLHSSIDPVQSAETPKAKIEE